MTKLLLDRGKQTKLQSLLLNTIDCTMHKQPIMLRHCSAATATATKYPMLVLQLAAGCFIVMIMEHEERHRDNQPFHGMNFNLVLFKEKILLSLSCGEKQQQQKLLQWKSYVSPTVRDCVSCGQEVKTLAPSGYV